MKIVAGMGGSGGLFKVAMPVVLMIAISCSDAGYTPGGGGSSEQDSERAAEARYGNVLGSLADALMRADYPAIHAMFSADLQRQKPLDAFVGEMQAARAEFGDPIGFESGITIGDSEELAEYEEYAHIPTEDLLAYGYVTLALEIDAEGEFERCYDCWVLIVNDGGAPKIGEISFEWCD